jgi:hypothetical protein
MFEPSILSRFARPELRHRAGGDVHSIEFNGSGDPLAIAGLAAAADRALADDTVESVVIFYDCSNCMFDVRDAMRALHRLRRRKIVLSYVRRACAPALLLALTSRYVYAAATAELGQDSWTGAYDAHVADIADAAFIGEARGLRPGVACELWRKLLHGTINGERAEMLGIVDQLAVVDWSVS